MRLIGERLLGALRGETFLQGEAERQAIALRPLPPGRTYHLFVSTHNDRAPEVAAEPVSETASDTDSSEAAQSDEDTATETEDAP